MPDIQLLDGKKIPFDKKISGFDLVKKISKSLEKKRDQYEDKEVELASQIIGIEKDIEYMKGSLGRIEQLVTSR